MDIAPTQTSQSASEPQVSIIVPALNEAANLKLLVPAISAALNSFTHEIIIVDDNSPDGTPDICHQLSHTYPLHLIVRTRPKNGLSGAVLEGFSKATGHTLVVMDADLQHPPDQIPALLAALDGGADFALGSRYIQGSTTQQSWGFFRRINSNVATFLASPFCHGAKDPMSGFFALRRSTYQNAQKLSPLGYKIALELMCKCNVKHVTEIPIHFGLRHHGTSKLTLRQQFKYLEHLSRLYDFQYPRASPVIKFLIATAVSWLPAVVLMVAGHLKLGWSLPLCVLLAYPLSLLVLSLFHARYVSAQREFLPTRSPWRDFLLIAIAEYAAATAVSYWLYLRVANIPFPEALLVVFTFALMVRYVLRKELLADIRGLRH